MDQREKWIETQNRTNAPLGEGVETITACIGAWVHRILQAQPAEPCDEVGFCDIPAHEWRRAIQQWCDSPFVRRAHGDELPEGLAMAVRDFDDATLLAFLESVV